jgi:hypothetical protein
MYPIPVKIKNDVIPCSKSHVYDTTGEALKTGIEQSRNCTRGLNRP